jgi:hypothetical protein
LRGGVQAAAAQTGRTASSGPAQDPLGAWTDMIGSMWGTPSSVPAARAPEPPKRTPEKPKRTTEKPKRAAEPPQADPISVTPFAPWAALMSGMLSASAPPEPEPPEDEPEDEPPEESPPSAGQPPHDPLEFFSHMVETGLDAQQQYVATLQNVFDSYWGAKPQRR